MFFVNKQGTCHGSHASRTENRNWFFIACLTIISIVLGAVKLNFIYYVTIMITIIVMIMFIIIIII